MVLFNPTKLADMQVNPTQLFNAEIDPKLEKLVCDSFGAACAGATNVFMYNIDKYLRNCKESLNMYYTGELNHLLANADKFKTKEDKLKELSVTYVAMLGVLHNYVCVGIDCREVENVETGKIEISYENALYTRNRDVIKLLAMRGLIATDEAKINKVLDDLEGAKTVNGFKDETIYAIRLDVVGLRKGLPVFDVASPKSRLNAGTNKDFVLIPVPFYYRVTNSLATKLKDRPFKFTKYSNGKIITHIATFSADTVRKCYVDCDPLQVDAKIKKTKIGFDVARIRIMAYDLESSLSSIGVASFRPEMLEELKPTNVKMEHVVLHNIDYDNIVAVYESKVKKFNVAQLKQVRFIDIKGYATARDLQEGLLLYGSQLSPKELYTLMKQNAYLFGDVDTLIANKEKASPKILKSLKLVDLDVYETGVEKKVAVEKMLNTGLVRLTMISKSNKVYERYCSNNVAVLERLLGKDYIAKFESIRHRIKDVKAKVESGEIDSRGKLEKVAVEYDILSYVNSAELFNKAIDKGFSGKAVLSLDVALEELNNKRKPRTMPESYIIYRNVKAKSADDFYGTVNCDTLLNVEYAEYVEPKTKE